MRTVLTVLALVVGPSLGAHTPADQPQPLLPEVNSWVAQIVTTGGVLGTGAGQWTIDSAGRITCGPPARCRGAIDAAATASVGAALSGMTTPGWGGVTPSSLCSDCYVTRLTLWMRAADGFETVHAYAWSTTDFAAVPPDVKRVYTAILESAAPPAGPLRTRFR